jgi:esterase/lipase
MAANKVKSVKPKKSLVKNKISSKVKLLGASGLGLAGLGALALGINKMKSSKIKESVTKGESENKKLIEMLSVQQEMIKKLEKENLDKINLLIKNNENLNTEIISIKALYEELHDTVKNIMEKVKWQAGVIF